MHIGIATLLLFPLLADSPSAEKLVTAGSKPVAGQGAPIPVVARDREARYYKLLTVLAPKSSTISRSKYWKPDPKHLELEVSGLDIYDDKRIAVAIRKGEVWILDDVYATGPTQLKATQFARALHEPLGLLKHNDSLYTVQRSELTQLRDTNDDDVADEYLCVAKGWTVSGNYHEYAYGPKLDGAGRFWLTLNIGLGLSPAQRRAISAASGSSRIQGLWRGWGLTVDSKGTMTPICAGMRSPSGLGANLQGDMFFSDQQGNWIPTCSIHHMRSGVFLGHPEALASCEEPNSPVSPIDEIPAGRPYPEAVKQVAQLVPPAVWLPYKKVGQSATDIVCDSTNGKFGPFAGQLFVGEFTLSGVNRVFLEKVDGEYQGACFPFRSGFASAVLRMVFAPDGSMFAGLSNRGWSSVGTASYGLQRLVWTGLTPFEIKTMRARPRGFGLELTQPVDRGSALDPSSYSLESYTYSYHSQYGSEEILRRTHRISNPVVSDDGLRIELKVDGLREMYVHELRAPGLRNAEGEPLLHPDAYYTLNRIPGH